MQKDFYADHKYDKRPMMGLGTKVSTELQKEIKLLINEKTN